MSNPVIDRLHHLVGEFDARVRAAPADAWDRPAPCDGWTAADVVAHVAGNASGVTAALTGDQPPAFDPADVVASWGNARDGLLRAVAAGDLTISIDSPLGAMSAEQMIGRIISTDVLVHTWDLARAVGGDERLDQDAVAQAYSGLQPMDAMIRRPGLFGPKIEPAEGDDVQTQFLKFLGRTV